MESQEALVERVLDCANRIANKSLRLPPDGDLPLRDFGFDSLTLFAFILELERTCGIQLDNALLNQGQLVSIRSAAALIERCRGTGSPVSSSG